MKTALTVVDKKDGILHTGIHPCSGWAFTFHKHKSPPGPAGTLFDLTIEMGDGIERVLTGQGIMRGDKNMIVGQGALVAGSITVKSRADEFNFEKAYASLARMQTAKNERYANSALKPLDIFARHHPYGARIDEKLARVKTADKLRKNDIADIIGGCMLLCAENGWDNFDDLID